MMYVLKLCVTLTIVAAAVVFAEVLDDTDLLLSNPVIQQLMTRVDALEAQDKVQKNRITELETRDIYQQQRILSLEDIVRIQHQQIEEMQLELTQTNTEPTEDVTGVQREGADSNASNHAIQESGNRIRRQQSEVEAVAFTAILVHPQNDLGLNQNVIFDFVETNIGNAYNQHHGVFIAPVAGTYVFHTSVFAINNAETWGKIVVNGSTKANAYARGATTNHDQGSQLLVVHLNQGDDVAVQNGRAHDNMFGNMDKWTTFSGFLLYQDVRAVNILG